jgi:G:T-mismatch repair DNA endonuclease (very short patch repair protein)
VSFEARKKSEKFCGLVCSKAHAKQTNLERAKQPREGTVKCLVCGGNYNMLTQHLISRHQLSTAEYKAKYGGSIVSEATSKKLSELCAGEKNAWHNHGGTLSPFSKNHKALIGKTDAEKEWVVQENMNKWVRSTPSDQRPMNVEYRVKRGHTEEEAKLMVTKRQATFSLDKCIEKYGEVAGLAHWRKRQEKWQETINSKPEEEIERINQAKIWKSGSMSKISLQLFEQLNLPGSRWGKKTEANLGERMISLISSRTMVDYSYGNKIIEFYGDYWHANERIFTDDMKIFKRRNGYVTAKDIRERDQARAAELCAMGFRIHIVWECDFRKNPEKVIAECLAFLEE